MSDPAADLQRFHTAQGSGEGSAYARAIGELQTGAKRTHWIWFVLPQLRGLGRSAQAVRYGITDLAEARAYLADPLLRERLETVIALISESLQRSEQNLPTLMGSELDAAKTISSLTLFEAAGLASAAPLLDLLGQRCQQTLIRLQASPSPADAP